jgi:hypothetical protein
MDVKETAKQIREILLLLLEGGYVMPIILCRAQELDLGHHHAAC